MGGGTPAHGGGVGEGRARRGGGKEVRLGRRPSPAPGGSAAGQRRGRVGEARLPGVSNRARLRRRLPAHVSGRSVRAERLRALRHGGQRRGVVLRLARRAVLRRGGRGSPRAGNRRAAGRARRLLGGRDVLPSRLASLLRRAGHAQELHRLPLRPGRRDPRAGTEGAVPRGPAPCRGGRLRPRPPGRVRDGVRRVGPRVPAGREAEEARRDQPGVPAGADGGHGRGLSGVRLRHRLPDDGGVRRLEPGLRRQEPQEEGRRQLALSRLRADGQPPGRPRQLVRRRRPSVRGRGAACPPRRSGRERPAATGPRRSTCGATEGSRSWTE